MVKTGTAYSVMVAVVKVRDVDSVTTSVVTDVTVSVAVTTVVTGVWESQAEQNGAPMEGVPRITRRQLSA